MKINDYGKSIPDRDHVLPGKAAAIDGRSASFAYPDASDAFLKTKKDSSAVRDEIYQTRKSWARQGKKIGMFTFAALATNLAPKALLVATSLTSVACAGVLASLILVGLEEKHIGIAKKIGGYTGDKAGLIAGRIKAKFRKSEETTKGKFPKVQLEKSKPTGKKAKEPILQKILHKAEKAVTGREPKLGKAADIGESIGAYFVSAAPLIGVPIVAALAISGPVGIALASLLGGTMGLAAGNIEENYLGAGRAIGEVSGKSIGAVLSGILKLFGKFRNKDSEPAIKSKPNTGIKKASKFDEYLAKLNESTSEPVMGVMLESTIAANRIFSEKPIQTVDFNERSNPAVNRERLLSNFIRLAGINGTSGKESAVGVELKRQLDLMGIQYKVKEDGTIIATIPGTLKDAPTVLLAAHQDTVSTTKPEAIIFDGCTIHTDEKHILGSDDRAGIAEIIEGVKTVIDNNIDCPEIKLVFTVNEETGLKGSSRLKPEELSERPTLGFVMDAINKRDVFLKIGSSPFNIKSARYNFSQEDPLIQVALKSMADAGINPRPIHAPPMISAHSDANTIAFNSGNIQSIALGTGADNVHTSLENVKLDDMEQLANTVVGLITNCCDMRIDEKNQIIPRHNVS